MSRGQKRVEKKSPNGKHRFKSTKSQALNNKQIPMIKIPISKPIHWGARKSLFEGKSNWGCLVLGIEDWMFENYLGFGICNLEFQ
ncbi:MAG: hypothetical protein A3K30_01090 [Deltaproteobacteria bacterium RBG_13_51_10]|jgi:hypothetical protein|nr:MAG: hypothetical protein A3K30_01090 [Deltaproteobacteria bacterium RBG_13_51_10]